MAIINRVIPLLSTPETFSVAVFLRQIRVLPFSNNLGRYSLIRNCGVLLAKNDIHTCIKECCNTVDSTQSIKQILTDAFSIDNEASLKKAFQVKSIRSFKDLKKHIPESVTSHNIAHSLITIFPSIDVSMQEKMLSWMEKLRPLNTNTWGISESYIKQKTDDIKRGGFYSDTKSLEYCQALLLEFNHNDLSEFNHYRRLISYGYA